MSRHTCMNDGCENDTGDAKRLQCSTCNPKVKRSPVEQLIAKRNAAQNRRLRDKARAQADRADYDAWARRDAADRPPDFFRGAVRGAEG